jgi:hypothetical protein
MWRTGSCAGRYWDNGLISLIRLVLLSSICSSSTMRTGKIKVFD